MNGTFATLFALSALCLTPLVAADGVTVSTGSLDDGYAVNLPSYVERNVDSPWFNYNSGIIPDCTAHVNNSHVGADCDF